MSYADFLTLLFALFVVLFASMRQSNLNLRKVSHSIHTGFEEMGARPPSPTPSVVSEAKPALFEPASRTAIPPPPVAAAKPTGDMEDLGIELKKVLGDSIARHEIVMQQNSDGLVISLQDFGFFNSGEAQLLPGAREELRRTAKVLMQHQLNLRVEGHSDDQPIHNATFHSNWELSTGRALTVLLLLVNDSGFDPKKISLAGYGPYRPIASNATPEGRQKNRRIDLVILPDGSAENHIR